jgi:hypothetical protein
MCSGDPLHVMREDMPPTATALVCATCTTSPVHYARVSETARRWSARWRTTAQGPFAARSDHQGQGRTRRRLARWKKKDGCGAQP